MTIFKVERETHEYLPLEVFKDGVAVTSGVSYAVVAWGTRPTTWTPAIESGGQVYFEVDNPAPGYYDVYVKIDASPETPVVAADNLLVK